MADTRRWRATLFKSDQQQQLFSALRAELETQGGYRPELIADSYRFSDWFDPLLPERTAPAAFFGRTPPSYDNACFALLLANGKQGRDLVEGFRALGAPQAFEIGDDAITQWKVGAEREAIIPLRRFSLAEVPAVVEEYSAQWSPDAILRAKNIAFELGPRQVDFIDLGLLPALESHVREKLDRLLRETLQAAQKALGKRVRSMANAQVLFQLVFRFLAAKILHDRGVPGFASLSVDQVDAVLVRVARHYGDLPPAVDDSRVKEVIASLLWSGVSLQNLSVEVLAYIYENTLVDQLARKQLGTHSTPASIARYIVHRLPFDEFSEGERRVLEPCSGHGIFLVAALGRLRELLPTGMNPSARHRYFVKMLQGYELDAFALEVSKLCLVLADFPNHNGWQLHQEDVFQSDRMLQDLRKSRIVLCNPPFEAFSPAERKRYPSVSSVHKPVEVFSRVLDHAHADAVLGFVLPRQFIDGKGYREIRERLARRYENLEVIALPDGIFHQSDLETALVIAQEPTGKKRTQVSLAYGQVVERDREIFLAQSVVSRREQAFLSEDELRQTMALPLFREVWERLAHLPTLGEVADIHRGVEWQSPFDESLYVSTKPKRGFKRGLLKVTPAFTGYIPAKSVYLSTIPEHRRGGALSYPWALPKVVANAATLSRGAWRLAAFSDMNGLLCSQRFHGIWPKESQWLAPVEAILNSPIANAFVMSFEGKRDIKKSTLERLPVPWLSSSDADRLGALVRELRDHLAPDDAELLNQAAWERKARNLILRIDAEILRLYDLPPRLEKALLECFQGEQRRVPFPFTGYYEVEFSPQLPLWMLTSTEFTRCNGSFLRERVPKITDPSLVAALEEVE
jgi:hypothetical protein